MNLRDIVFDPQFEDKHLDAAKNFLVSYKDKFRATANFAIIDSLARVDKKLETSCHNSIAVPTAGAGTRVLVATENGTFRRAGGSRSTKDASLTDGFLDWFVNRSPYGRFLVYKDMDFCRNYGFIFSADVATPLLQNCLIVTRHFFEVTDRAFQKFDELVKSGVDEMIAYPLCFNSGWSSPHHNVENGAVQGVYGHRANPLFNFAGWKNWLNGDLGTGHKVGDLNDVRLHYRNYTTYTGGSDFFFDRTDVYRDFNAYSFANGPNHFVYELVRSSQEFRDALAERRKDNSVNVYKPPNPFAKRDYTEAPALAPEDLVYSEFWELAVPWCLKNEIFTKGASNG